MPRKFIFAAAMTLAILECVMLPMSGSITLADYGENCAIILTAGMVGIVVGERVFLGLPRLLKHRWHTRILVAVLSVVMSLLGGFVAIFLPSGMVGMVVGGSLLLGLSRLLTHRWYTRILGAVLSAVISLLGGILATQCLMGLLYIETPTSHELIDMWGALYVLSFGALSGVVGFVFGAGVGHPSDRRRD